MDLFTEPKAASATFQADILSYLRPNENAIPSLKTELFLQNREEEIFPGHHNDAGVLHTALLQSPPFNLNCSDFLLPLLVAGAASFPFVIQSKPVPSFEPGYP